MSGIATVEFTPPFDTRHKGDRGRVHGAGPIGASARVILHSGRTKEGSPSVVIDVTGYGADSGAALVQLFEHVPAYLVGEVLNEAAKLATLADMRAALTNALAFPDHDELAAKLRSAIVGGL